MLKPEKAVREELCFSICRRIRHGLTRKLFPSERKLECVRMGRDWNSSGEFSTGETETRPREIGGQHLEANRLGEYFDHGVAPCRPDEDSYRCRVNCLERNKLIARYRSNIYSPSVRAVRSTLERKGRGSRNSYIASTVFLFFLLFNPRERDLSKKKGPRG